MKQVLVTGARGFIGKNLCLALKRIPDVTVTSFDIEDSLSVLKEGIGFADVIYHLAGINRPVNPDEYKTGNYDFTKTLLDLVAKGDKKPHIIATSSTQASLDNPYGISKRMAEEELFKFSAAKRIPVHVYRLTNVFGKWSKPFYNSVIATFCHQSAHNEALMIDDLNKRIDFIYIDDIVHAFLQYLRNDIPETFNGATLSVQPAYNKSLGEISSLLEGFKKIRENGILPDLSDGFEKKLYSTYLSYLEPGQFSYSADKKEDARGYLYELIKTKNAGQIFVSRTLPGITRGNHYHDTKVEKFCVIDGNALVSFRHMLDGSLYSIEVEGQQAKVIDIPPGYTHNIKNIGATDMLTLFWANEIFDPSNPDTYYSEV